MGQKIEYLEVKFALGLVTLAVGFVAATIALFQWVDRTGVHYLLGGYSRYVLGFGGFAAMIFGSMLINDAWVLRAVMKGKYELSTNRSASTSETIHEETKLLDQVYDESEVFPPLPEYKERIAKKVLKTYGSEDNEEQETNNT
ncbi:hypothetical protein IBX35_05840 [Candidatus Bathyarchaeota archaeon]|nr:hypothetical protein [Candidatus Bathyarchaeota archaeon]